MWQSQIEYSISLIQLALQVICFESSAQALVYLLQIHGGYYIQSLSNRLSIMWTQKSGPDVIALTFGFHSSHYSVCITWLQCMYHMITVYVSHDFCSGGHFDLASRQTRWNLSSLTINNILYIRDILECIVSSTYWSMRGLSMTR